MLELLLRQTLTKPWMLVAPICAAVAATGLVVGVLLHWSTMQADLASASREEQILSSVLNRSAQRIAKDQEAVTVWDDAIANVATPDPEWLDANLGVWMHDYYGHDRTYILNGRSEPVYAMVDGERVAPESFGAVRSVAAPLVRELRRGLAAGDAAEAPDMQTPGAHDIAVVNLKPPRDRQRQLRRTSPGTVVIPFNVAAGGNCAPLPSPADQPIFVMASPPAPVEAV